MNLIEYIFSTEKIRNLGNYIYDYVHLFRGLLIICAILGLKILPVYTFDKRFWFNSSFQSSIPSFNRRYWYNTPFQSSTPPHTRRSTATSSIWDTPSFSQSSTSRGPNANSSRKTHARTWNTTIYGKLASSIFVLII